LGGDDDPPRPRSGDGPICTSVCSSPLDEITLERAIAAVTRALAAADEREIGGLVEERRALRDELRELRERAETGKPERACRRGRAGA
jgi:hypothetical protein